MSERDTMGRVGIKDSGARRVNMVRGKSGDRRRWELNGKHGKSGDTKWWVKKQVSL